MSQVRSQFDVHLLDEISIKDNVSEVIHKKLKSKERIMGFRHRVYKTIDPRAEALKKKILKSDNLPEWIELALETEKETIKLLNYLNRIKKYIQM